MPEIPEPVLLGDELSGTLYETAEGVILILGTPPDQLSPASVQHTGPLVVRYALPYYQEGVAIVPGLFASDYGECLVGRQAWDYAQKHFTIHPRGTIAGLRTDGDDDERLIRELDFGCAVEVYAYESPEARSPLARLSGFWMGANAPNELPELLVRHLPRLADFPGQA